MVAVRILMLCRFISFHNCVESVDDIDALNSKPSKLFTYLPKYFSATLRGNAAAFCSRDIIDAQCDSNTILEFS